MTRAALYYRFFYICEHADGTPPVVRAEEGCIGNMLEVLPNCREMTKSQLLQWLEYENGFKSFTDTEMINSQGKYSACHIKVVDAWLEEYEPVTLPPGYKPWEEGENFGTR